MTLGAFVIHGNARATLPGCLDDLEAVADEVVTVDSGSTDGSLELVESRGLVASRLPWQGYGAARARAAELLARHDYVFFLDADERLGEGGVEAFRRWRKEGPSLPYYRLVREDWAELDGRRFLYRREGQKRVVRRDMARWTPRMIVHESLPRAELGRIEAVIVHGFASSLEDLRSKQARYALLWALAANARGVRAPRPTLGPIREWTHLARDLVWKGALLRGGAAAVPLARVVARYHGDKYRALRRVEEGAHNELVARLARGELPELFRELEGALSR